MQDRTICAGDRVALDIGGAPHRFTVKEVQFVLGQPVALFAVGQGFWPCRDLRKVEVATDA